MNRGRQFARNLFGGSRIGGSPEKRSEPLFDLLTGRWYGASPSRQSVAFDDAQAHPAVFACVAALVKLVAWQMPAYAGEELARATIVTNPHPEAQMTAQHWRAEVLQSALLRGFAAGFVTEFEPSGWPKKILPLHPDLVSWWDDRGRWRWTADGKQVERWQDGGNLWVAPSLHPASGQPVGLSVLRYAAQTINLGLSAVKFGDDFFTAGGMPVAHGKVTTADGTVSPVVAKALKERILSATRDREPLITGTNIALDTIPINADESQFLQTIQANDARVCMFFGVPPEVIGGSSGDSSTYSNVEGRNLMLLTHTVGAWMTWFETLFSAAMPPGPTVTLDPESLLRTSVPTLFSTARVGLDSGMLDRDEARAMIGYGPGAEHIGESGMTPKELAEALQKIYLAVGKVITSQEAREILNRSGAGLAIPGPDELKAGVQ